MIVRRTVHHDDPTITKSTTDDNGFDVQKCIGDQFGGGKIIKREHSQSSSHLMVIDW